MAKRANWRVVKTHRSYKVDEVARLLGVSKGTIRRWIKNGLSAMQERKPALIKGAELIDFLKSQSKPKQKCAIDECFCFSCRSPQKFAFGEAEIDFNCSNNPNLRGLCAVCSSWIFKRISKYKLSKFEAVLQLTITQAGEPINNRLQPCSNEHLRKETNA